MTESPVSVRRDEQAFFRKLSVLFKFAGNAVGFPDGFGNMSVLFKFAGNTAGFPNGFSNMYKNPL